MMYITRAPTELARALLTDIKNPYVRFFEAL
jgi:hypothetical protein